MQFQSLILLSFAAMTMAVPRAYPSPAGPNTPTFGGPGPATNNGPPSSSGAPGSENEESRQKLDSMTVQDASKICGADTQVKCCNKASFSSTDVGDAQGLLGDTLGASQLLNGVGLFDQCSSLDLGLLINPLQNLLNSKCKSQVACCQEGENNNVSCHRLQDLSLPIMCLFSLLMTSSFPAERTCRCWSPLHRSQQSHLKSLPRGKTRTEKENEGEKT
jgi:hypothetical protein